ncbi:AtpZ/AtpI family protein [Bartonella sp. F02]|uniref:AtpZ/AtpI family protein n=1 Tax=Bartonella sp. F02 TaxID=2967262 RepID=UPI0022A91C2E|nr:AtpZ/AtpI family protein [Bartonella sp. F02]MCZ2328447.1 AtpZ/AtpI family protein [Bartonella sp. F02]
MEKDNEPIMSEKEAERQEKEGYCQSEDLTCRSRKLGLALMRQKALKKTETKEEGKEQQKKMARAIELSSEFLASIVVGIVLGLGVDKLADSSPWGLIFFLFLGFAAGVLSILRSVGHIAPSRLGQRGASRQDKGIDRSNK